MGEAGGSHAVLTAGRTPFHTPAGPSSGILGDEGNTANLASGRVLARDTGR